MSVILAGPQIEQQQRTACCNVLDMGIMAAAAP
jgi:hypothetical protein